jgi:hypothetical protein
VEDHVPAETLDHAARGLHVDEHRLPVENSAQRFPVREFDLLHGAFLLVVSGGRVTPRPMIPERGERRQ